MIDTHCHLSDDKVIDQFEKIRDEAIESGVPRMILPSVDLTNSKKVVSMIDGVSTFGLVGVHPEEVASIDDLSSTIKSLRLLTMSKGIVGIGECGLDFYWDKEKKTKSKQIDLLRAQIELALELDLPVVLHNRESNIEMEEILKEYSDLKLQLHCFDGSANLLELGIDRGYYFSFCGNITYKNNDILLEALRRVPTDRLLLETDSPYLTPMPKRGQVNNPANVRMIAEYIAESLEKKMEEITTMTTKNAERLFTRLC